MKTFLPIRSVALAMALAASTLARAEDTPELFEKLRSDVNQTIAEHKNAKEGRSEYERLHATMAEISTALAPDSMNVANAKRLLAQLTKTKASPAAKEMARQLAAMLVDPAVAEKKEYNERIEAALKKAAGACMAATKDSDLDSVEDELSSLKQNKYTHSPECLRNVIRIDVASRFLALWQEYLAQLASGYQDRAKKVLHDMIESPGSYPLLTRDQIMQKLGGEPKIESVESALSTAKTLEDLPAVVQRLSAVNQTRRSIDPGAAETSNVLNQLKEIYKAHAAAKAGLYSNALQTATNIYDTVNGLASPELIRIKTQLLAEILPPYLGLPEGARPNPGENPSQFLLRVADDATAKGEWEKVPRVLEAYRSSAFGFHPPAWLNGEITACGAYLSAQNLQNAGDFKRAAREYEKVLLQPGKRIPVKEATERLVALKKEHPEAIEAITSTPDEPDDSTKRAAKRAPPD